MIDHRAITLTVGQQAAVARLAYALESPAAVAILCGPPGVGKSLVLGRAVATPPIHGRPCHRCGWRDGAPTILPDGAGGDAILLVDDAHEATAEALATLVESWRRNHPAGGVVLAGEGRLLTLVARDARIERAVILRATLGPFTRAESTLAVAAWLPPGGSRAEHDALVQAIHDLAAGIPARVVRLAELVQTVASGMPAGRLTPADVEAVHRRLSLQAA
jgi:DNA polymerase III delta prime subunit